MALEVEKKTDLNVLNMQAPAKKNKMEDMIKAAEDQKRFMFEMMKAKMKNFVPSDDGDSSEVMNQHFNDSSKITEIEMNVGKMRAMLNEQTDAKANRYLGKEVHYNGQGRKAIYSKKDGKAVFSYNIREGLLPEGHKNLVAHIVVKGKYGKQIYKTKVGEDEKKEQVKIGENRFVFTGREEGAKGAFDGQEYTIEVDLEYKLNGKKERYYELVDYASEVVDTKDGDLVLSDRTKLSIEEAVKHNKVKSSKEKKEEEREKVLPWNDLLGKNVEFKDKDPNSGELLTKFGKVASVHRDEATRKPDSVMVEDDFGKTKIIKIDDISSVSLNDSYINSQNIASDNNAKLIERGRGYFGSDIMLENDEYKHDGNNNEFSINLDEKFDSKIVIYDESGKNVVKSINSTKLIPEIERLTDDSWKKIKKEIKKMYPPQDTDRKIRKFYNDNANIAVTFDQAKHLIKTKDGKISHVFKINAGDLTKDTNYTYKIFVKQGGGDEKRIDITHTIKGYGVDTSKDGKKVLSLQYTDGITKQERSITPDQIISLGSRSI